MRRTERGNVAILLCVEWSEGVLLCLEQCGVEKNVVQKLGRRVEATESLDIHRVVCVNDPHTTTFGAIKIEAPTNLFAVSMRG